MNPEVQALQAPTPSVFDYLKALYFWIIVVILTIIFFSLIALDSVWRAIVGQDQGRFAHKLACIWGSWVVQLTPGWNIEMTGRENLPHPDEPLVIVANHESMSDIWAMYCLKRQFRWISKESIFKIPCVGFAMKRAGYVSVRRGDRDSHNAALAAAADRINKGVPMFFFPEGTRSNDGRLRQFKAGAFKIAKDAGVRVLPVALRGASKLMPKGSGIPGKALLQIAVLPALDSKDFAGLEDFADTTRSCIAEQLKKWAEPVPTPK